MKKTIPILTIVLTFLLISCSKGKPEKKVKLEETGFEVTSSSDTSNNEKNKGINKDSVFFETRPSNVLLTGVSNTRLTTIYKVNINKEQKTKYIGTNYFHFRYLDDEYSIHDQWNNHLMPGIEAAYGYNMVNVSCYNVSENKFKNLFEKPCLMDMPTKLTTSRRFKLTSLRRCA